MKQAIKSQTVDIQWIRSQFTGQFAELLLNFLRYTHIKYTFH